MKQKIIKWLYDNYVGYSYFSIRLPKIRRTKPFLMCTTYYGSMLKASRIIFPFFISWGIFKLYQSMKFGEVSFCWWFDIPFLIMLAIQYIASFTSIIKDAYEKNNKT